MSERTRSEGLPRAPSRPSTLRVILEPVVDWSGDGPNKMVGTNSRRLHLPDDPLGCTVGSVGSSPNTRQRADLSRRIFSLVDIIASLIPVTIVRGKSIPGFMVGLEGEAKGVRRIEAGSLSRYVVADRVIPIFSCRGHVLLLFPTLKRSVLNRVSTCFARTVWRCNTAGIFLRPPPVPLPSVRRVR